MNKNKINPEHGHVILVNTFSTYLIGAGGKFAGRGKYKHARQSRNNEKNRYNFLLGYNSKYNKVNKIFKGVLYE